MTAISGRMNDGCRCVCNCQRPSAIIHDHLCINCSVYHWEGRGHPLHLIELLLKKFIQRSRCYCACGCKMKKYKEDKACNYCLSFCHPSNHTIINKLLHIIIR